MHAPNRSQSTACDRLGWNDERRLSSCTAVVSLLLCSMTTVRPLCLHVLFLPPPSISSPLCDAVDGRAQGKDLLGPESPMWAIPENLLAFLSSSSSACACNWFGGRWPRRHRNCGWEVPRHPIGASDSSGGGIGGGIVEKMEWRVTRHCAELRFM